MPAFTLPFVIGGFGLVLGIVFTNINNSVRLNPKNVKRNSESVTINADTFYSEYHGHKLEDLQKLLPHLRQSSSNLIWTAGDSSLDNKFWLLGDDNNKADAVGGYGDVLVPKSSVCDVTYWLNYLIDEREELQGDDGILPMAAINAAVEATTLNERESKLRDQDIFLRDNIQEDDVLIVSIGGNDVALEPTSCTICSMAGLLSLPQTCTEDKESCLTAPCTDCCECSASSPSSSMESCPPCFDHFRNLFGVRVKSYIEALTQKTKPKKILVCMIYYPDEKNTKSWANGALYSMGYNENPKRLQAIIAQIFEEVTSQIEIDGTQVIPVPLFLSLDGTNSRDYVERVEPSLQGGKKMAEFFLDIIDILNSDE